jgi:hypothetical protein
MDKQKKVAFLYRPKWTVEGKYMNDDYIIFTITHAQVL